MALMFFRRRTVEALLRQSAREKEQLLAVIRDQNDRLMLLAGRQYAATPLDVTLAAQDRELEERERIDDDEGDFVDVGQAPDNLGFDPY